MSNLTDLLPAGAGGKQVEFVASGNIDNGATVALKTDGTVEVISSTGGIGPIDPLTAETPVQIYSNNVNDVTAYYDTVNNKVVAIYSRAVSDNYGMVSLGSVSGSTITFGTPIVYISTRLTPISVVYLPGTSKCVLAVNPATGDDQVTVGTVSGDSFSIGTRYDYAPYASRGPLVYDPDQDKVVHAFNDRTVPINNYGTVRIYTISGTSISLGSKIVFASASTGLYSAVYDAENAKVVIAYQDVSDSQTGKAIVATISGSSASFGTAVYYDSDLGPTQCTTTYDPVAKKIGFFWRSPADSIMKAAVGTVSGTSISFGTVTTFGGPADTVWISSVYCPDTGDIIVVNLDYMRAATISGTSISFGTEVTYRTGNIESLNTVYDTAADKVVITNRIDTIDFDASVINVTGPASNNTDFIGISDSAISDTASGSVTIKGGISTNVTGLTPNATYYVQDDGSLSTTASDALAGKALSSTSINLDYTT